uniref:Cholinergic receptor, nicotinic, gamma n=1 Tax=Scleropages formosus TaxID=113540 RepID=A0A8C9R3I8_SCLFO
TSPNLSSRGIGTAILSYLIPGMLGMNLEGPLLKELMNGYSKNIRPVKNSNDVLQVKFKLTLTNLISLNEREEALTTSVWTELQWCDYRLKWDHMPAYENITCLRVPSKSIWLPDIVLENNVDGNFEIALYTNALVNSSGCIQWLPPAIYRSACSITVSYFPFDWQNCSMVFRSHTYSANDIDLILTSEKDQTIEWIVIDPEAFTENGEWAIKHRPAKKLIHMEYSMDELEYQELVFFLIIQRKPLFYIINIIVPCVLISSLGLLVYYLPAKAGGQKCTMSIATLLAQTVFLFLIAKKVPETSQSLHVVYLMFVMSVTTTVVMNCVIVLNVSLRTPNTHLMTDKVRKILLNVLPKMLHMRMRPWTPPECSGSLPFSRRRSSLRFIAKADEYVLKSARSELMFTRLRERAGLASAMLEKIRNGLEVGQEQDVAASLAHASPEVQQCVTSCKHIAESTREQSCFQSENQEWFLVARVIDRVCFIVMALLFVLGTVSIFLMGHFNQAPPLPFPGDPKKYLPE